MLDEKTTGIFLSDDIATQKIIVLIAIAKQNRLFYEYLYEVYREKVIIGVRELSNSDINVFFKNKQEQSEEDIERYVEGFLKNLSKV